MNKLSLNFIQTEFRTLLTINTCKYNISKYKKEAPTQNILRLTPVLHIN